MHISFCDGSNSMHLHNYNQIPAAQILDTFTFYKSDVPYNKFMCYLFIFVVYCSTCNPSLFTWCVDVRTLPLSSINATRLDNTAIIRFLLNGHVAQQTFRNMLETLSKFVKEIMHCSRAHRTLWKSFFFFLPYLYF